MKSSPCSAVLLLLACALNGVQSTAASEAVRFQFRKPHPVAYRLEPEGTALSGEGKKSEWLKAWPENGSTNYVELGNRVVLQLADGTVIKPLLQRRPLQLARTVAKNLFILQASDVLQAAEQAQDLAKQPGVLAAYPCYRDSASLNGPYAPFPTDKYYYLNVNGGFFQWYLESRNPTTEQSTGFDLNVRSAWPFARGAGVTIAVADLGIQTSHPELSDRAAGSPHYNFANATANPAPYNLSASSAHGTEVAGLAVATMNNNIGGVGVAPEASLASWVIYGSNGLLASDEQLMDMFQYASNTVAVQNHSWSKNVLTLTTPSLLEQVGLSNALTFGRQGRGVVMVRAAGNSRTLQSNTDDDAYQSDPRVITVAAIRQDGRVASYSVLGASVLVAAPGGDTDTGGLFTTDLTGVDGRNSIANGPPFQGLWDYVYGPIGFSGTSASSPQIAGIVALILSANTNLTSRDVQQILILSSRHFDFADPDLTTNGAGLRVSHNLGFGVPDAGQAVQLARSWINRPPLAQVTLVSTNLEAIPDDGLRVEVNGPGTPPVTQSLRAVTSNGLQPDAPMPFLPLVDCGLCTNVPTLNLTNSGALILRGGLATYRKIQFAAQAGAAFAVVYNYLSGDTSVCPGGDQLCPIGGADFVPIPAVFIGNTDGTNLTNLIAASAGLTARIHLNSTNYSFAVTNTLLLEHVGVRLQTDHPLRGDLRITLLSPSGTRSVLQRYNTDTSPGPADWTYWTTHDFFESSFGEWRVELTDEYAGAAGSVHQVDLILKGVPIQDVDHDGLDDLWEMSYAGDLATLSAGSDPNGDGYNNAREQIMGTNPLVSEIPFRLDLSPQRPGRYRLSWPSVESRQYQIWAGTNVAALTLVANVAGRFPETEWTTPIGSLTNRFFQVRTAAP